MLGPSVEGWAPGGAGNAVAFDLALWQQGLKRSTMRKKLILKGGVAAKRCREVQHDVSGEIRCGSSCGHGPG